MLESLVTSKTRIKLLLKFFLNSETQAYLRELASEFGESTNAIRVELNRLTDANLLKSKNSGRTILYRANTNHTLFKDIQSVVRKYVGIDRLIDEMVKKLGHLEAAYITGDYAHGLDTGIIDLVLVGKINSNILIDLTEKTSQLINRKIRTLVLSKSDYKKLSKQLDIEHALPLWLK